MIRIFDEALPPTSSQYNTIFKRNGLGSLQPSKCVVSETLNGEYELEIVHPIDDAGKWKRIQHDRIISAPVPASPDLIFYMTDIPQYRVVKKGVADIRLKSSPFDNSEDTEYVLHSGDQCQLLGERRSGRTLVYGGKLDDPDAYTQEYVIALNSSEDGWMYVDADGQRVKYGYIRSNYLFPTLGSFLYKNQIPPGMSIVDTEDGKTTVLLSQLFRIYKIVPSLHSVTAYARHISYDMRQWPVPLYNCNNYVSESMHKRYADAVIGLFETARITNLNNYYRTLHYDYEEVADLEDGMEYKNTNVIEALMGGGGILEKTNGEIARNNMTMMYVKRLGEDRGVYIRNGKNIKGIEYTEDWDDVVWYVMPVGKNNLYLNGKTSHNFENSFDYQSFVMISPEAPALFTSFARYKIIEYSDADTVEKLKKAVERDFENGLDKPKISVTVDFLNVEDTVEYEQYKFLQGVFLGDTIHAIANRVNIDVALRVTQYTFNCLTRKYDSITLGEPKKIDLKV